jgi:hypothetical protein
VRRDGGLHGEFHGTGFCGIVDIKQGQAGA